MTNRYHEIEAERIEGYCRAIDRYAITPEARERGAKTKQCICFGRPFATLTPAHHEQYRKARVEYFRQRRHLVRIGG